MCGRGEREGQNLANKFNGLFSNLMIKFSREILLMWRREGAGREPAKNNTGVLGVFLCSLINPSRQALECTLRDFICELERIRLDRPLIKTGAPYIFSMLSPSSSVGRTALTALV